MSILSSLYNGASGMTAQSAGIAVVGDNIANINTVGFKGSRANFADVLGLTVAGAGGQPSQIGLGVRFAGAEQVFNQGSFSNTGVGTDLALDGGGFFVVSGTYRGQSGQFYTRAGGFQLNSQGLLVNNAGLQVQGYGISPTGVVSATPGPLQVSGRSLPARATGQVQLFAALDSRVAAPPAFNVLNAAATSNSSTSLPVYDSLGQPHNMQVYFRNTGANSTWEWYGVVDGGELQGGLKGTPQIVSRGTMAFTNTGALAQAVTTQNTVNFVGAAPNQTLSFNFGDAIAQGGSGLSGSSAAAQSFSVNKLDQDGYAPGVFTQVVINGDGTLNAAYSNGQQQAIGRLAIASFASNEGLHREGGALWSATHESGQALLGTANTGGRGQVVSGSLELSNVDLTEQFVQMIALQRGFQANSKTIQASDDNYVTLVQLRR